MIIPSALVTTRYIVIIVLLITTSSVSSSDTNFDNTSPIETGPHCISCTSENHQICTSLRPSKSYFCWRNVCIGNGGKCLHNPKYIGLTCNRTEYRGCPKWTVCENGYCMCSVPVGPGHASPIRQELLPAACRDYINEMYCLQDGDCARFSNANSANGNASNALFCLHGRCHMECGIGGYFHSKLRKCILPAPLYTSCLHSEECQLLDENAVCTLSGNVCVCEPNFVYDEETHTCVDEEKASRVMYTNYHYTRPCRGNFDCWQKGATCQDGYCNPCGRGEMEITSGHCAKMAIIHGKNPHQFRNNHNPYYSTWLSIFLPGAFLITAFFRTLCWLIKKGELRLRQQELMQQQNIGPNQLVSPSARQSEQHQRAIMTDNSAVMVVIDPPPTYEEATNTSTPHSTSNIQRVPSLPTYQEAIKAASNNKL